jgi:DNA-directed RNA polymerase subunit RPC12/RpoP
MLRQGAWYPVLSNGATRTVLEVSGRRVAVPSDLVEIRPKRPDRFTVVYRPRDSGNPARGTRSDLGRMYAVCPACGSRVRLVGHPRETKCPCGFRGEIAWWETG